MTNPAKLPPMLPLYQSPPEDLAELPPLRQPLTDYINPHGEDNPYREALNAVQPPDEIVI